MTGAFGMLPPSPEPAFPAPPPTPALAPPLPAPALPPVPAPVLIAEPADPPALAPVLTAAPADPACAMSGVPAAPPCGSSVGSGLVSLPEQLIAPAHRIAVEKKIVDAEPRDRRDAHGRIKPAPRAADPSRTWRHRI